MAKRRATTQAPDTGTVDSAMGGSRRGTRRPSGYAGRIESGGRGDLGDQALGENNRGTGGKGAPSTGFGAGAPGSTGGGDLGQGTGGGVVEQTTRAYDQPTSGDSIDQSYLDNFQTGVEMAPEIDSSGSALPGRQPVNPISATYAPSPTASRTATPYTAPTATQRNAILGQTPRPTAQQRNAILGQTPKAPTTPQRNAILGQTPQPTTTQRNAILGQTPSRSAPPPPPVNTVSYQGRKRALR